MQVLTQILPSLFSLTAATVGLVVLAFRFPRGVWAVVAAVGCLFVIGTDVLGLLFAFIAVPLLNQNPGHLSEASLQAINTAYFVMVDMALATGVALLVLGACLGRGQAGT